MDEENKEEKENPGQIGAFIDWLTADWSHVALVIVGVFLIFVLIAWAVRR